MLCIAPCRGRKPTTCVMPFLKSAGLAKEGAALFGESWELTWPWIVAQFTLWGAWRRAKAWCWCSGKLGLRLRPDGFVGLVHGPLGVVAVHGLGLLGRHVQLRGPQKHAGGATGTSCHGGCAWRAWHAVCRCECVCGHVRAVLRWLTFPAESL